jgi:hypothetical protein
MLPLFVVQFHSLGDVSSNHTIRTKLLPAAAAQCLELATDCVQLLRHELHIPAYTSGSLLEVF